MSQRLAYARRIAKWTGLILTATTLIAFGVFSCWCLLWRPSGHFSFALTRSQVICVHLDAPAPGMYKLLRGSSPTVDWGFSFQSGSGWQGVWVPLWFLTLAAAIPSAVLWRADRRARRVGGCVNCGYDLSGLPTSAACPECGQTRCT